MKRKYVIKKWQLFVIVLAFAFGMTSFMIAGHIGSEYGFPTAEWIMAFTDMGFVCCFVIGLICFGLMLSMIGKAQNNEIKEKTGEN